MEGNPMAQGQVGGTEAFTIPDAALDGVYTFHGDCPSATIDNSIIKGFKMYPNPVNEQLYIDADVDIDSVVFFSILGQKLYTTSKTKINVKHLKPGAYIVKVTSKDKVNSYKLVKI
jgi:hypothetical protein